MLQRCRSGCELCSTVISLISLYSTNKWTFHFYLFWGWGQGVSVGSYTKYSFKCFVEICCCCLPSSPLAQGPTCLVGFQLLSRFRQCCLAGTAFSGGSQRQSTAQCPAWPLPTCSGARSQNPAVLFCKKRWRGCWAAWPGGDWWRGCIWQRAGARSSRSPAAARSSRALSEAWGAGAQSQTPGAWSARSSGQRSSCEECHLRCSRTCPWHAWLSAGLGGPWRPARVPRQCSPRTRGSPEPPFWRSAGRRSCSAGTYPDGPGETGTPPQKCTWISGHRSSGCRHLSAPGRLLSAQNPLPVSCFGHKEISMCSHKLYLHHRWKWGHLCSLGLSPLWYWCIWSAGHYSGHTPPAAAEYLQKTNKKGSLEPPNQEKMGFSDQKQHLWSELSQISLPAAGRILSWTGQYIQWHWTCSESLFK